MRRRHHRPVADDHLDGEGLAGGTRRAEHDGGQGPGRGARDEDVPDRLPASRAERQRCRALILRDGDVRVVVTAVTVGRIMMATTSEPASQLKPTLKPAQPNWVRRNGTRMTIPSQPHTTLGIPTNTSSAGWTMALAQAGATSDRKIASPIDSGAAMRTATAVTPIVPAMNGRIPKLGGRRFRRPSRAQDVRQRHAVDEEELDPLPEDEAAGAGQP